MEQSRVTQGLQQHVNWDACLGAAIAGNPPCKDYAKQLLVLARDYGVGTGAVRVQALDTIAKMYNETKVMGEEVLTAIMNVKLPLACTRFRHGLMICNLTSTKVVDGIARCIGKGDVSALVARHTSKEELILEVEDSL